MSNYPVGATWKATNKHGSSVTIWLAKRETYTEMWMWRFAYSDGSNGSNDMDWGTSYQSCYNQSAYKLWIKGEKMPRFKRIE